MNPTYHYDEYSQETSGQRLAGFCLLISGLLLAMALTSYNPEDPSWNTATDAQTANILGQFGAVISDLLLQIFGHTAFLIIFIFLVLGVKFLFFKKKIKIKILNLFFSFIFFPIGFSSFPVISLDSFTTWPNHSASALLLDRVSDLFRITGAVHDGRWMASILVTSLGIMTSLFALGATWLRWKALFRIAVSRICLCMEGMRDARTRKRKLSASGMEVPGLIDRDTADSIACYRSQKELQNPKISTFINCMHDSYNLPPLEVFCFPPIHHPLFSQKDGIQNARTLETVLSDFGVRGRIIRIRSGPVVTLYELEPAPGIKASRVVGLSDDIARSMGAFAVRVTIAPGQAILNIELPNIKRATIYLHELLVTDDFDSNAGQLVLSFGKDICGVPVHADLAQMPHLLIAGAPGTGQSVVLNTILLSLLYRLRPTECRLVILGLQKKELSAYNGIPHLLVPVVCDAGKAVLTLKWIVLEMENRYRTMSQLGIRNMSTYNQHLEKTFKSGRPISRTVQTGFDPETGKPVYEEQILTLSQLPFIVVIVAEIADLMLIANKEVENLIQSLSRRASAVGIHVIMATHRPSTEILTGTIRAAFPARISFQASSKRDSRTILGEQGAEQLLEYGDMLYLSPCGHVTRVHGPSISNDEVEQVVQYLWTQSKPPPLSPVSVRRS